MLIDIKLNAFIKHLTFANAKKRLATVPIMFGIPVHCSLRRRGGREVRALEGLGADV